MSDVDLMQLHQAIVDGKTTKALGLIAKPGMRDHVNKMIGLSTCLHLACMTNNTEVCKALLDIGADTEVSETYGGTPLHCASDKGHLECVKLLVTHGNANVKAKCGQGYTAHHLAIHNGHTDVADYLRQFLGGQGEKITAHKGASPICPFYGGAATGGTFGTDVPDACPVPSNPHMKRYGMGYRELDKRLVQIQAANTHQVSEVHKEVNEVRKDQNQLKEEFSGFKREAQDHKEMQQQLERRVHELEININSKNDTRTPRSRTVSRSRSACNAATEMTERLQRNFRLFADSIVANDIMYGLFEKGALTGNDLDEIDNVAANGQKTIKLLRILFQKKDPSWVFALRDTLLESETEFMQNLVNILENDNTFL